MKLSIVMPVYNEGPTIAAMLDKVRQVRLIGDIEKELVVVNDASGDNSEESILEYKRSHPDAPISYVKHDVNMGKGAAIHTGIRQATGDFLVVQDADLEYDPPEFHLSSSRSSTV